MSTDDTGRVHLRVDWIGTADTGRVHLRVDRIGTDDTEVVPPNPSFGVFHFS